jgi:Flp pilus assembly protein TadG
MSGIRDWARHPARRSASRGQALVEFALVLPIFVLMLMVLFDFGRVVYAQHTIAQDAREASRKGQVEPASPITVYYSTLQYTAIRNAALAMSPGTTLAAANITGDPAQGCAAASGTPGVDDLVAPNTCFYPDGDSIGGKVVVNIKVSVPLLILGGGSFDITAQSVAYIQ